MTENNTIDRPPLSEWQTELIRLTAFPSPLMNTSKQNWWEDLVGELPLKQNREPRTFEQSDDGPYKDGRLVLSVSPIRIDWVYTVPELNLNEPKSKLSVLGSFEEVLNDFSDFINRWLSMPDLVLMRLAFGAVLLQPVETNANGYSLISSYLPFALDSENTSDLLYRINRRRQSKALNGLVINRLSTWSVISIQNFALLAAVGRPVQQNLGEPIYSVRLELDINSAPDFEKDLLPKNITELFQELTDLGIEIATNGDQA